MKFKSFISFFIVLSIIATSTISVLLASAVEKTNSFATQHMEVDFSNYSIRNGNGKKGTTTSDTVTEVSKDYGNTRFGVANDGVSFSIKGDTDKYLNFSVTDQYLNRYFYSDRACIINPTGGTTSNTSYYIDGSAKYRISFDYLLSKEDGTGDVYVLVYSNSAYTIINSTINKNTNILAKIKLDSTMESSQKTGWYATTVDFDGSVVGNSSLAFAFVTSKTVESSTTSYNVNNNFAYEVSIDNIVADRLGTAVLHYGTDSTEVLYGIPESTNSNMRCKDDGITPNNDVYSTTSPEKINLPKDVVWYSEPEFINKVTSVDYFPCEMSFYAQDTKIIDEVFKTQHMKVDFNDYAILNGNGKTGKTNVTETTKNNGNTRFGLTNDGISISIDGNNDKYLHFSLSEQYLNRYYYCDRAIIMNPTGGITEASSYCVIESANYRISFDYQLSKEEATGDVFVIVYSNSGYTITNSSINKNTKILAKIKLDCSVKSENKDGWYKATADFVGYSAANSSLAFTFVTSRTGETSVAPVNNNTNFAYDICVDNVVADRMASARLYFANGEKETLVGVPKSTKDNMYSNTEKLYSECEGDIIGLKGNWFEDPALSVPVDNNSLFKPVDNKRYYQEGYSRNASAIIPSTSFQAGTGTENDPFLISTANELAYLASLVKQSADTKHTTGKYYKLTNDIIINEDVNSPKYSWITGTSSKQTFNGTLDGNGFKISGLFIDDMDVLGGLFISLGNGAVIKNLGLTNSYIETVNITGAFAATVDSESSDEVQIIACYCDDSVIVNGNAGYVGGFVGYANTPLSLRYCYFTGIVKSTLPSNAGTAVGSSNSKLTIKSSYFAPNESTGITINEICGTVGEGSVAYNTYSTNKSQMVYVRQLSKEDMMSSQALRNMTRFDFENIWSVSDKTPVLKRFTDDLAIEPQEFSDPFDLNVYNDAKPGDIWSGGYSSSLEGSGTKNDPYLISTAEDMAYLAKIVSEHRVINKNNLTDGKYYKLTDDIYLNDVSDNNWTQKNPKQWIFGWSRDQAFSGYLDGAGHVIYGMYFDETDENMYCSLLIATDPGAEIKNLGIANSVIYNHSGYSSAITCGIRQMKSTRVTKISNCFVASDVIIESISGTVGGILAGAGHAFSIEDCYSLATVAGAKSKVGTLLGYVWSHNYKDSNDKVLQSDITNCFGMTKSKCAFTGSLSDGTEISTKNLYSNSTAMDASESLPLSQIIGENAKNSLVGFDFTNIWEVMPELSAGLKIFSTVSHKYTSSFYFTRPITTITFDSNKGKPVNSISGYPGDKLVLPTTTRNADIFEGWYVYSSLDVPFTYDFFPEDDITLYAKYQLVGSDQDFEDYEYSTPGLDGMDDDYEWFGIGSSDFSSDYIHNGIHSLHRKGLDDNYQVASIANTNTVKLLIGNEYTFKMYVYLKESELMDENLILAYLKYPDWAYEVIDTQNICKISSLQIGDWKEITFNFVAAGEYLGIVTPGYTNLFIDDITVIPTGKTGLTNQNLNGPYSAVGVRYETYEVPDDSVDENSTENTTTKKKYKVVKKIKKNNQNRNNNTILYILVSVVGVIIVLGAIVCIIIIKKRKRLRN